MVKPQVDGRCVTRRGVLAAGLGLAGLGIAAGLGLGVQRAEAANSTAYLEVGKWIYYGGYLTPDFSVNGAPGFCANPSLPEPKSGYYEIRDFMDGHRTDPQWDFNHYETIQRPEVKAILYYGWDAPGFSWDIWPPQWIDGTPMDRDRVLACEHILLSDTFALDFRYATYGCTADFVQWARDWLTGVTASGTGHVANWDNCTRAKIEAVMYTVPDSFSPYQLYTGPSTQRVMTFWKTGEMKVQKQASHSEWL